MKQHSHKKLLLTFDYELFQGLKSGSVTNCLLKPTTLLLELLKKFKLQGIFFIDVAYLLRMEELSATHKQIAEDLSLIKSQIARMASEGHEVFLHLHPHWLDAVYTESTNNWELKNFKRFGFNALSQEDQDDLFKRSIEFLGAIIHPHSPHARMDGYRAGGLCIQPFASFKKQFENYGIIHEFSVLKGYSLETAFYGFDFTQSPAQEVYSFNTNPLIAEHGSFKEYCISEMEITGLTRLLNSLWYRIWMRLLGMSKPLGDGRSTSPNILKQSKRKGLAESLSVELMNPVKIPLYLKYIEKNDYIHFISHPKLCSYQAIQSFGKLLEKTSDQFSFRTDFRNWD